ncbi:fermentation-respiration switch protein FrsA (DUF1100 family) [Natronospira proteinivora]|uniref:Fermentation-respiration switch protein FrsA (DUF1100 family) n=1 Tax=Natronospira proteinivora TaxID=1807133 RepID=A0ABT1GB83_9GAMM|nr:alpha/beta hydrolase [Natronospira proteinivora]MCP1728584.1 fermentation-respiration switch protein FrsA (DUF1100 family) [Natronospira proteinivora]
MLRWLMIFAVAYLAVLALLWVFQNHLLYQPNMPTRDLQADPAERGWEYEDVHLSTGDGVELHGWWIPASEARASLIFFHGNAGNISHRLESIAIFRELGLSVLIIDYRGYGQSEGSPSEGGLRQDARAAWTHLREDRQIPAEDIVLFGRSLGSAVASELAREHQPGAVILESAFRSVPEMAQAVYPFFPARWLARMDYDNEAYVQDIQAPLLMVHSEDDEIIPYEQGRAVYETANQPKDFLTLQGGHNTGFLDSRQRYIQGLDQFLSELAGL